ncbi:MbcA/ParS/Xre antitoxin family protein [uncultured Aliivibrio sp.]|uniref:MbcA/ParS/Xre antitoxin family protein n=1 Tax=uncultured Aliivibrio sp. TaxID=873085 RepID=UPI002624CDDD|nr:MbcA/ParS/Xre antitoxin family protein [uncultured Aliivibrio sp.]
MKIAHIDKEVREKLLELFADEQMSEEWITTQKVIFNGLSPLEVLDSEQGKTKVLDAIQRITYGDFS